MSPGLLQLQSTGIQDIYLTKDPQINIFKYTYYRYVNFATEVVRLPLNEIAAFNKRVTCDIPKRGHMLSKLYLHLKMPKLVKQSGTYASWSDAIGYALFSEPIELEVGGVVIDKLYPQFLDIWDEFTNGTKRQGKNFMLGKSDIFTAATQNATKPLDLLIPLDFWFTKQYSSALPLLSMHGQDVRVNFKFKDFSQVVNYDGDEPAFTPILDSQVFAEYVFLDDVITEQFQRQKHMYVIEQTQFNGVEVISADTSIYNSKLKFNHPVKELIFACAETANVENNNYFAYSNTADETSIISEASLFIDGKQRFESLPECFYRNVFPDIVHNTIPMKYVYCMPFAIRPEDNQPTGSINMSRFNDVVLTLKLPVGNQKCYLYVYAINYNIVTVEKGTFTLAFAS
jgi:hypothetical protein